MSIQELHLVPESDLDALAEKLWARMVGAKCPPSELHLFTKLALEHRVSCSDAPPYGLDKLGTEDTASYIGLKPETLRDKAKRRVLGIPPPYQYGRKLFWRRSELDHWIEKQRRASND